MTVIDNVAPCKTKQVKGSTRNWFDREILQKFMTWDKLFKASKKPRLYIDKELYYKKAKYDAQNLIAAKKQAFFDEKLSENVDKPKELRNNLKSLGMPKKTVVSNFTATDSGHYYMTKKAMSNVFEYFFSNLGKSLLVKIADPSNKYNLESVFLYYSNFAIREVFHIKSTSEEKVFKIMEYIGIYQSAGIDELPGRFLKDGAEILSEPNSEILKLSISHGIFPNDCKVAKLKPIFKKGKKVDPSKYGPISLLPLFQDSLKKYFMTRQLNSSQTTKYYITINLDPELITRLICVYLS